MGDGALSQIRLYEEDTYGGGKGAVAPAIDFVVDEIGGGPERAAETQDKMRGSLSHVYARAGRHTYERDFLVEVGPSNQAAILALFARTSDVQKSYEIWQWDGSQFYKAQGVKVNRAEFRVAEGELVCRLGMIGNGGVTAESATNGITSFTPWALGGANRAYELRDLALTIAADANYVREGFVCTVENNLKLGPPAAATGLAAALAEGQVRATAQADVWQKDAALLAAMRDETLVAVSAVFTRGSNTLTFTLSNCLVSGIAPNIRPNEEVKISPTFTPTGATPFSIVAA